MKLAEALLLQLIVVPQGQPPAMLVRVASGTIIQIAVRKSVHIMNLRWFLGAGKIEGSPEKLFLLSRKSRNSKMMQQWWGRREAGQSPSTSWRDILRGRLREGRSPSLRMEMLRNSAGRKMESSPPLMTIIAPLGSCRVVILEFQRRRRESQMRCGRTIQAGI